MPGRGVDMPGRDGENGHHRHALESMVAEPKQTPVSRLQCQRGPVGGVDPLVSCFRKKRFSSLYEYVCAMWVQVPK